MKKWNISVIALVIAAIITLCLLIYGKMLTAFAIHTGADQSFESWNYPTNDTAYGTMFATLNINDSVPHYIYKKAEDSLKKITDLRDYENKGIGAGISTASVGVVEIEHREHFFDNGLMKDAIYKSINDSIQQLTDWEDTVKRKMNELKIEKLSNRLKERAAEFDKNLGGEQNPDYYFVIKNYTLDYPTSFFIKNGLYNLAYIKFDSTVKRSTGQTKYGHYEHKQIAVRYGNQNKTIMIPITKAQYQFLYNAIFISIYFIYLLSFYFFIGLPFKLLTNISRGKAFNKQNITYLKKMSYAAFAYFIVGIAFIFAMRFTYRNLIPNEFQTQSFLQIVADHLIFFLVGIALFIVAKAFERGYNLQTEQDLTI
jgi:hypothetical protein